MENERIKVKRFVADEFQAAEAIKTLRTNLMFCGNDVRAIGITSFGVAEGKTSVSFQLAASLAQNKKNVLLLDGDLRKSVLQNRLGVREKVDGLSHLLSGMAEAKNVVKPTDIPGLFIMFAGARVPNASELLGSERMKKLIPALKDSFDYIIADMAPLGQVIDCAVAAPALDGVLLVIDTTHSSYKLERRVVSQLERTGSKVLGVVLNHVDFKDKGGYYGKAYGYGYGYGEKYGD